MKLEFKMFNYFFSMKPTKDCLFSRRNGYKGKNLLGYNYFINKLNGKRN